jgi:hypothetical protein
VFRTPLSAAIRQANDGNKFTDNKEQLNKNVITQSLHVCAILVTRIITLGCSCHCWSDASRVVLALCNHSGMFTSWADHLGLNRLVFAFTLRIPAAVSEGLSISHEFALFSINQHLPRKIDFQVLTEFLLLIMTQLEKIR